MKVAILRDRSGNLVACRPIADDRPYPVVLELSNARPFCKFEPPADVAFLARSHRCFRLVGQRAPGAAEVEYLEAETYDTPSR